MGAIIKASQCHLSLNSTRGSSVGGILVLGSGFGNNHEATCLSQELTIIAVEATVATPHIGRWPQASAHTSSTHAHSLLLCPSQL